MITDRIIATLNFFDLQDIPLTLFEVHRYLLNDASTTQQFLDTEWEIAGSAQFCPLPVSVAEVYAALAEECQKEDGVIQLYRGHYFLKHRDQQFVVKRLNNYLYAVRRESRIRSYAAMGKYLPFVRGIGLVGSQALGKYGQDSDIDILVFTHPQYMWFARMVITTYFQLFGIRRHGSSVKDRYCLNHYVAGPKSLSRDRNIYTASEYLKMRELYPSKMLRQFKQYNGEWVRVFFSNAFTFEKAAYQRTKVAQSRVQYMIEQLFDNSVGKWIERQLQRVLVGRIKQDKFVVVEEDELSFHPHNRKADLFAAFFKHE